MYKAILTDALIILDVAVKYPSGWKHLSRLDGFIKKHGNTEFTRNIKAAVEEECREIEAEHNRRLGKWDF